MVHCLIHRGSMLIYPIREPLVSRKLAAAEISACDAEVRFRPIEASKSSVCYVRLTSTPGISDGGIFSTSSTSWRVGGYGCSPDTWIRSNPTPTSFRPLQEPYTHCHARLRRPTVNWAGSAAIPHSELLAALRRHPPLTGRRSRGPGETGARASLSRARTSVRLEGRKPMQ
jgi:hypothetical protein